ncbi:MAG TPA: MarR family transcriptional regulator [Terriglobales bacterium]|nr:MarR family transcriptional regulator [Terriglobales bacterium]
MPLVNALWESVDRVLEPLDITARQGALLVSLQVGEAATTGELARAYGVEMSSVTRMLERMERKGLVRRARSGDDRRKVIVRVTAAGKRKVKEALPLAAKVAQHTWHNVTAEERQTLHRVIDKVLRNLGVQHPLR